jgi:hypothetical protein
MGKKSDTAKPVTAIAESPASTTKATKRAEETAAPATKMDAVARMEAPARPAAASAPGSDGDGAPPKTGVKKKAAKKAAKKVAKKKMVIFSTEDVALRAYFIAENRQRHGLAGDSHSDWIEAERQLKKEARKKPAKKKPRLKKRT